MAQYLLEICHNVRALGCEIVVFGCILLHVNKHGLLQEQALYFMSTVLALGVNCPYQLACVQHHETRPLASVHIHLDLFFRACNELERPLRQDCVPVLASAAVIINNLIPRAGAVGSTQVRPSTPTQPKTSA